MESLPEQVRDSNLQELAGKSWNLELIISGAAIFLVSYLPALVDKALWYYLENLAAEPDLTKSTLPILAYSFFKVIAWLLIGTFVVHFILRAFWVGLVGLHAVYPAGIRYDQLPMQTDFSREMGQQNFGQFTDYIHRIDRLSNQIFSFAFLIALMSFGISTLYLIIFIFTQPNILQEWLGGSKTRTVIFFVLFMGLSLLPAAMQILMRRPNLAQKPGLRKFATLVFQHAPGLLLPGIYRPLSYLNLIYTSNVPRKRLWTVLFTVFFLVMGSIFWVFIKVNMELRGRNILASQEFIVRNNSANKLFSNQYDNLRQPDDFMPTVSLTSDVVEGPVLRVFVSYRKWLDASIARQCTVPKWPDSLSKSNRRLLQDSVHLNCLAAFFQVSINDSLYRSVDWIFHTRPETGTHGLIGYIPTNGFQPGKNTITLRIPDAEKKDSLQVYGTVPFWFYTK